MESVEVIDPAPADILDRVPLDCSPHGLARMLMPGGEHREVAITEGITLRTLIETAVPVDLREYVRAFHFGLEVRDWDGLHLRAGDKLILAVVPQGGGGGKNKKGIIGAVLTIAVAVFASWAAPAIYGALGGVAGAAGSGLYISAIQAGITLVGAMAISALVKPASVNTAVASGGADAAKSYSLTGQSNAARPYGACLVVYGRHKVMPALAANPDVDNWGQNTTLTALYDFGLGWVGLEDLRIGDVSLWEYSPEVVVHQNSLCQDLRLATRRIGYDQYAITLAQNDPITVRTKTDTFYADMDIQFPKGIFRTDTSGNILPFTVDLAAFWRKVGDSAWTQLPVDHFYGASNRYYTTGATPTIEYQLGYGIGNTAWFDYYPSSSPAHLRALAADWRQLTNTQPAGGGMAQYNASVPNENWLFQYPSGPIDEANYFARYPEIKNNGWPGSATNHFEAIGSREGRDPLVPVFIKGRYSSVYDIGWYAPSPSSVPTLLHRWDRDIYGNPDSGYYNRNIGGWYWIDNGGTLSPTITDVPFTFRVKAGNTFDGAVYLQRYPDVAAAGLDPWQHFISYGAFEGRDPYAWLVATSVRNEVAAVGPFWLRLFFVFPAPGEYELQVVRTDASYDGTGGGQTQKVNEAVLGILRSYQAGPVVQPRLKHTMLEMRVRASDQLAGVVQNLSAIATSVLRVAWRDAGGALQFGYTQTRNPAWIVLDMLTSEKNPRPLSDAQVDWDSWIYLAGKCDAVRSWVINGQPYSAPRYTCDIVITDFSTVMELAESVLSGCRSSIILTKAGTWGVLHDEEKTTPRQLITPANSWNFGGSRTYSQVPHALRVAFINRDNAWSRDETIVYNDGYNASNATVFETLDTYGITDYAHAWAYGRFMLAQGIQRAELFTLTMDVENLLVQRGDLVHVAHDVPRVGGVPSRIVSVADAPSLAVKVDRPLTFQPSGYAWRSNDGTMRTGAVSVDASQTADDVVVLDRTDGMAPDDLIVLGEYERVVWPYLVQRITPASDFSAELTLCKYVKGVYDADTGAIPPWDPGFGHDYLNSTDLVDFDATATSRLYYVARYPRTDVLLQWKVRGWGIHHHEVTLIMPTGVRVPIANDVGQLSYQWTLDALKDQRYYGIPLQFEIVPVSSVGFRGQAAYASITLQPDTTAPAVVPMFGANVQKETIDLFWQHPDEPDIGRYLLRYTPNTETPVWNASQQLAEVAWPGTKVAAGARTGSYGIRVEDTSGNLSDVVWRRTTVAVLPEINVIEVVNDIDLTPAWPGKVDHAVVDGRELRSEGDFGNVYPVGIYYCFKPVDLGDVFEVRVSSKIEAYGIRAQDYMHNWVSLHEVKTLVSGTSDDWDCWLEARAADEMEVIHLWPTMHDADPIASGTGSTWSPWRPVSVGDFTAQMLQFRIVLKSLDPDTRVVVRSGRIEVDMPDRVDSYGDVDVSPAGLEFMFDPAFRELEAVAISINGNPDPVVAEVTNKSPYGLTVKLRNTVSNAYVAGSVDIMAEGYGRLRPTSI